MSGKRGSEMRKFLIIMPLIAAIAACSSSDSLENKGQQAGAAADNAIERVDNEMDAAQDRIGNSAAKANAKAHNIKQDINAGLRKANNAVDAAAAELKK
jgi:hypothetical protein